MLKQHNEMQNTIVIVLILVGLLAATIFMVVANNRPKQRRDRNRRY